MRFSLRSDDFEKPLSWVASKAHFMQKDVEKILEYAGSLLYCKQFKHQDGQVAEFVDRVNYVLRDFAKCLREYSDCSSNMQSVAKKAMMGSEAEGKVRKYEDDIVDTLEYICSYDFESFIQTTCDYSREDVEKVIKEIADRIVSINTLFTETIYEVEKAENAVVMPVTKLLDTLQGILVTGLRDSIGNYFTNTPQDEIDDEESFEENEIDNIKSIERVDGEIISDEEFWSEFECVASNEMATGEVIVADSAKGRAAFVCLGMNKTSEIVYCPIYETELLENSENLIETVHNEFKRLVAERCFAIVSEVGEHEYKITLPSTTVDRTDLAKVVNLVGAKVLLRDTSKQHEVLPLLGEVEQPQVKRTTIVTTNRDKERQHEKGNVFYVPEIDMLYICLGQLDNSGLPGYLVYSDEMDNSMDNIAVRLKKSTAAEVKMLSLPGSIACIYSKLPDELDKLLNRIIAEYKETHVRTEQDEEITASKQHEVLPLLGEVEDVTKPKTTEVLNNEISKENKIDLLKSLIDLKNPCVDCAGSTATVCLFRCETKREYDNAVESVIRVCGEETTEAFLRFIENKKKRAKLTFEMKALEKSIEELGKFLKDECNVNPYNIQL